MRLTKTGAEQGRILTIGCALLAVGVAVLNLVSSGDDVAPKFVKSMARFSYAAGEAVGLHLAETHSGSRVLILVEPTYAGQESDALQIATQEGIKQGLGSALEVVDTVAVDPPPSYIERARKNAVGGGGAPEGMPDTWIPAMARDHNKWFDSEYFATILAEHKGTYDVLISAVGLPRGFAGSSLVKHPDLPKVVAVLNAPDTPIKRLILGGTVDALVYVKPSDNPWQDAQNAPEDIAEAFAKRYILVTSDNVNEVAATYPKSANWQ